MSLNQIYDPTPGLIITDPVAQFPVAGTSNMKFNKLRAREFLCFDARINNLYVRTINGNNPLPNPGLNGQFLQMVGSTPQYQFFSLQALNPSLGSAKSLLSVNSTGNAAEWSKNLQITDLDIANNLTLNGVSPLPGQFLGVDLLSKPQWQVLPPASVEIKKAQYNLFANTDLNEFASKSLNYQAASYDALPLDITQNTAQIFNFLLGGEFCIEMDLSFFQSNSEVTVQLVVNGLTVLAEAYIGITSTAARLVYNGTFLPGDLLSVVCVRIGVDATAKLTVNSLINSPICFTKLL
jgi:hypothetical protein